MTDIERAKAIVISAGKHVHGFTLVDTERLARGVAEALAAERATVIAEVVPVLDTLMKHCAESHYNDCAWLHTDESECNCGSEKAWDEARALLAKLTAEGEK